MPTSVDELKKYKEYEKDEIVIAKWLEARKGQAYTYVELWNGIKGNMPLTPDEKGLYLTWENVAAFGFNLLNIHHFHETLKGMVTTDKIKMIVADGEEFYYSE